MVYNHLDRLASAVAVNGTNGTYALQNYDYHPDTGNLSIRAGVKTTYGDTNHDHAVTQMGSDSYSYDNNGNQVTRNVSGSSYALSYDAENRLVGVTGAATQTFVYDGDGNRVKSTGSYMNLAEGIVPTGDVTINNAAVITDNDTWAENSSQYASASTQGLHYVRIDLGATYSVNKINVWHYANDGRTYHGTKTQVSENGTNWVTVYDSAVSGEYQETPQGKTITFTTQNVRYVRDYVNGNTVNASDHWTEIEVWGKGTVTYVGNYLEWTGSTNTMEKYYYAGSNRVAVRRGASSLYWLMGDHLGSQAITTDANGSKISEVRYYPWGRDRYYAYTSTTTFRFTGQRTEFGLGLYYYGARFYDSAAGRFIQADTIIPGAGNPQAWDRYAYTLNNPVKYVDPSGHRTCTDERAATGDETCDQNNSAEDLVYLISFLFNWEVEGEWLKDDLLSILEAGKDIISFIDSSSGKSIGAKWIRNYLATTFTHGNRVNKLLERSTTQWRDVELYKDFSKEIIVHELGHILDNHAGSSTSLPATWIGGGSADGLIRYLGGIPFCVRWLQVGIINLPDEYKWNRGVDSGYGNKSSAEYFAQTFRYAVYDPTLIPGNTDPGGPYAFIQALVGTTVTFLGP